MPYLIAIILVVFGSVGFYVTKDSNLLAHTEETGVPLDTLVATTTPETAAVPEEQGTTTTPTEVATTSAPPPTKEPTKPSSPSSSPSPSPKPATTPTTATHTYKNGSYSSDIAYRVPESSYTMHVNLTVKDGIVTASSISFDARGARDSRSTNFEGRYQSYVVGKRLENINLSRVGGASLTTNAFNKAVTTIKSEAHT